MESEVTRRQRHALVLRQLVEIRTEYYIWHHPDQLASATGMNRRQVLGALRTLHDRGLVDDNDLTGRGFVKATEAAFYAWELARD